MTEKKELLRQTVHILYWPLLIYLHWVWVLTCASLLILIIFIWIIILMIKHKIKIPILFSFLQKIERWHDFENFPWKGFFYFSLAALWVFYFFETNVAYASILILCSLDSVSNIIWRHFGAHRWPINREKSLEWSFAGLIVSTLVASFFISIPHAFFASLVAMIIEIPDLKIWRFKFDDNLLIPFVCWVVIRGLQ